MPTKNIFEINANKNKILKFLKSRHHFYHIISITDKDLIALQHHKIEKLSKYFIE